MPFKGLDHLTRKQISESDLDWIMCAMDQLVHIEVF